MDHIFIIFPRSPNTRRILYNAKYGLKELNKICGLNIHLDSFPKFQHLHKTHWRCYQRRRGCWGMPNTLLQRWRALVRFSARVLFPQRISGCSPWHSPSKVCQDGARPGTHSFQFLHLKLIPCTKYSWLPKTWERCQNHESSRANPTHRKGQQGHRLSFT